MQELNFKIGNIKTKLNNISSEDLLCREVITINDNIVSQILGKTVMVTGGGGSIGSELCRQILKYNPKKLIVVDIYENNAYQIEQELFRIYGSKLNLHIEIASIRDLNKMEHIFKKYKPDIVYHAAAHKHVPLMENAPDEAVKNNIFGTYNLAFCADKYNTKKFVLISTDKAVNPTNIMGATKRVCEMIIQCMNKISPTEFVAVRFGNVLGSNGSVIPLFKEQIACGGPVTVTHPEIIRYFMTITEAVNLVLNAGYIAKGGEIFILDMGSPVKILDLAENLIKLSGLKPYKDIDIIFTGLRPGEKLYEELLMKEENLEKTSNQKIFICKPLDISPMYLFSFLNSMKLDTENCKIDIILEKLHQLVPTYLTI